MPPRNVADSGIIDASEDALGLDTVTPSNSMPVKRYPVQVVWRNVAAFAILHLGALYGIYMCFSCMYQTLIWAYALYIVGGWGITAGAHRLWAHRSYKAKWPLRVFLALANTSAFQNDVIEWARDHRCHHKYSETDADPHNATRGFFFAHMGWLLVRKHPEVAVKGKGIDLSDMFNDPVLRFQRRFYLPGVALLCFVLPAVVPVYVWGENWVAALTVASFLRYCVILHITWLVNSAAHMWGWRPYDTRINPAENFMVAISSLGEGYHNYHHTFPHDYSTSEFGWVRFNLTTLFIDTMRKLGLAYDCRKVDPEVVRQRKLRTGVAH